MIVEYYSNIRNPHKLIEVHMDGHRHYSVRQIMLCDNGVVNRNGDGCLHRWKRKNLVDLLDDYEVMNNVIEATCSCCGRIEQFPLTPNEYSLLNMYRCYGRQMGMLQELFPRIPGWIRSGAIDQMSNGFCICPRCCR